jgi:nucleoid DNA-binding protein
MLPKNSKHFIQPTAEELECDATLINDVVNFFYAQVKKDLNELVHHNVHINELGTFSVVKKRIKPLMDRHKKHLDVLTKESFDQVAIRKKMERKYQNFIKLKELIQEETERRQQFYKNKNESN